MVEALAQDYIRTARAKGLVHMALTVTGLSLNLLGDGLRDTLDPRGAGMVGGERR
jgi:ABC-type dipeptide/oligopeptide/nickel transport system permease subunit